MAESNNQPPLCPCGIFFGTSQTSGLCSKCFAAVQQQQPAGGQQQPGTAGSESCSNGSQMLTSAVCQQQQPPPPAAPHMSAGHSLQDTPTRAPAAPSAAMLTTMPHTAPTTHGHQAQVLERGSGSSDDESSSELVTAVAALRGESELCGDPTTTSISLHHPQLRGAPAATLPASSPLPAATHSTSPQLQPSPQKRLKSSSSSCEKSSISARVPSTTEISDPCNVAAGDKCQVKNGGDSSTKSSPTEAATATGTATSSTSSSPSTTPNKRRCGICKAKLQLAFIEMGRCDCGNVFCSLHRLPEQHQCSFDHKGKGRAKMEAEMVLPQRKVGTGVRRMEDKD